MNSAGKSNCGFSSGWRLKSARIGDPELIGSATALLAQNKATIARSFLFIVLAPRSGMRRALAARTAPALKNRRFLQAAKSLAGDLVKFFDAAAGGCDGRLPLFEIGKV